MPISRLLSNHIYTSLIFIGLCGCSAERFKGQKSGPAEVNLGYFPNVTHAQAVVGVARGDFQKALGDGVKLKPSTYNAGPSVIEAVFAGHLDIAYVGPSPILNGYIQSKGEEVRVVAGAAENGVLVVANAKRGFKKLDELRGKKIATPQLGNTQDISARNFVATYLKTKLKEHGGDTEIIPVNNPDIELLFQKDQLDAAWVPEPWGSRMVMSGLAAVLAEEKDLWEGKHFALTNIIARRKFLEEHPDIVKKILDVHAALTSELQRDAQKLAPTINAELKRLTGKDLPAQVISDSLKHVQFSTAVDRSSFDKFLEMGKAAGVLKAENVDLTRLFEGVPK